MLAEHVHVFIHMRAFTFQVVINRGGKLWMRQPIRLTGFCGHESACNFVLAFGSTFKQSYALSTAVIDALVLARL